MCCMPFFSTFGSQWCHLREAFTEQLVDCFWRYAPRLRRMGRSDCITSLSSSSFGARFFWSSSRMNETNSPGSSRKVDTHLWWQDGFWYYYKYWVSLVVVGGSGFVVFWVLGLEFSEVD